MQQHSKSPLIWNSKEYKEYEEKKKMLEKNEIPKRCLFFPLISVKINYLFSIINLQYNDNENISAVDKTKK